MFAAAALLALTQMPAAKVAPIGTWSIDYGARYCSLIRYPDRSGFASLTLRRTPGTTRVEMLVLGPQWRSGLPKRVLPIAIVLSPSGRRLMAEAVPFGGLALGVQGIGIDAVPPQFLEMVGTDDALAVEYRGKQVAQFGIPSSKKALKALDDCNDRLLASWGVDAKTQATFRAEALPKDTASWFPSEAYPAEAIRSETSGNVVALVSVSAAGAVDGCRIVGSGDNPALDTATCKQIITKGRYDPALDSHGQPVASKVFLSVNWVVPTTRH